MTEDVARARLRIVFEAGFAIGPGKADLLQEIESTGSIAAAGRRMGMSYKRAWSLVEELNSSFVDALVEKSKGGSDGGGAFLTDVGHQVLDTYRVIEAGANAASAGELASLNALVKPSSRD
jgi:molybdate transport system regulatory protein